MIGTSKHIDSLMALIAAEIGANPVELDGFQWCGLPQPIIAAKLGFSVETLRRQIGKPPIVRKRRKGVTLLRVGEPGPVTNYDLAQDMSGIWRKATGKTTSPHQFHCLLGLAGEWPDGKQVELFKRVLADWTLFMSGVKHQIDLDNITAEVEGTPAKLYKRHFAHPSIPVIRRFASVALDIAEMDAQASGQAKP